MKGKELIALWEKAKKAVADIHGHPGGEIGCGLRARGYAVTYDGSSVCSFDERKIYVGYSADCCDNPWQIGNWFCVGPWKPDDSHRLNVERIDPESDYPVPQRKTFAEEFADGDIEVLDGFEVWEEGNREIRQKIWCATFEEADEVARKKCRDNIERNLKDSVWRRYSAREVKNDELRAAEKSVLRYYQDYDCDGHRWWTSVRLKNWQYSKDRQVICL